MPILQIAEVSQLVTQNHLVAVVLTPVKLPSLPKLSLLPRMLMLDIQRLFVLCAKIRWEAPLSMMDGRFNKLEIVPQQ
jgi:hypothetical protein